MFKSLWGEEFNIPDEKDQVKKVVEKIAKKPSDDRTDKQKIKSKAVSILDKLELIKTNVLKTLGTYVDQTVVIYKKEDFINYINEAIKNNIISIDTETDNSLDPTTCKIMGLCIYTPGQKNAYIPVNHVDPTTREKLTNQLTEADLAEQLSRLDSTTIIMHNSPFDYQVIGFTTGVWLHVDWDTMVGAKILDENESAGLKYQYVNKIDATIEKYSINDFFESIEYAVVNPDIFALYAATDAYMTYKLYQYQKELFSCDYNKKLFNLFKNIEMPVTHVAADMERTGVYIDTDYAERLASAYRKRSDALNSKIEEELKALSPKILEWRLSPEANIKPKKKQASKNGEEFAKSKNEQLKDPIDVASPTQLSILIYDVLKYPPQDKKTPRGTGENILEKLTKKGFKLGDLILEKRGIDKLLNTFIEAIPKQVSPRDGRLHAHFNVNGTATGRFSSSQPNLQNIPSSEKSIRLIFQATPAKLNRRDVQTGTHYFTVDHADQVETGEGFRYPEELKAGDSLIVDSTPTPIREIEIVDNNYLLYV